MPSRGVKDERPYQIEQGKVPKKDAGSTDAQAVGSKVSHTKESYKGGKATQRIAPVDGGKGKPMGPKSKKAQSAFSKNGPNNAGTTAEEAGEEEAGEM
jgi:hypothetical protein